MESITNNQVLEYVAGTPGQVSKFPEWRELYAAYADSVQYGRVLSYAELSKTARVDIQSPRGRSQIRKFAKTLLRTRQKHLENIRGVGYRVVEPVEHLACGAGKMRSGQRRFKEAAAIFAHTDEETLSQDEQLSLTNARARVGSLLSVIQADRRAIAKTIQLPRVGNPVLVAHLEEQRRLTESKLEDREDL